MQAPLDRRSFLQRSALGLGALAGVHALGGLGGRGLLLGRDRSTDDDEPSEAVRQVLRERLGERPIRKGHVELDLPAEPPDGRVVPVFIESDLPMRADDYVRAIHLIVDKNPDIYLAGFHFSPQIGRASIDTRIKMRATSWVRAIAETSRGELWAATRKVFPMSNGCG